ncbi:MAG: helix-turn-helix domain-containing protein [Candidatus Gastranaerophilales bacterium]|nr:helix-turn-helix domain-containing protein [Candidatus Gastranaerophilales bacterium]MCM1072289.1 helix-turn-helix domain-containing protein [Bacteroides sp.]
MNITELQEILKLHDINLTGRALAEIWGVNEHTITDKKRNGSAIKYKNLKQLEEKFNITLIEPELEDCEFPTMGERIKFIRKSLGFSQEGFAEYLGLSRQYMSQMETNKNKMSIENLAKLLEEKDVSANYVIAGVGHPFLPKWDE